MHGHLVAVEVRVECSANQGMDADRLALDQHRLESLNAEAVKSGSAVEQHGMLADDVLEDVPDGRFLRLDELLGLLDRGAMARGFQAVIDERLEQLERHLLRQAALVQLQFGTDDDDGAARIVHALAEKVLAEAALLALEGVGQRFERAVVRAAEDAATASVVEQRVNSLLQHALFVADDHVGSVQLHELLQAVIAVDHAAIQIVQVRGGKAAAVERHQRAQLGRQDGNHVQNHPLRLVAALAERFEDLEALGELDPLLQAGINLHFFAEFGRKLLHIHAAQKFLDGLGAHAHVALSGEFALNFAEFILGQNVLFLETGNFSGIHADEGLEVENVLEIPHGDIQQVADAAGQPLEKPHVRAGRSQLNVAKALAADFAKGDFDPALVADDSAVLHALVFAAEALPVGDRAENLGAEQPVALRLKGAVVDGLRLGYFAVRPGADFFRARKADANRIKIGNLAGTVIRARSIQGMILPSRFTRNKNPLTKIIRRVPVLAGTRN